MSLPQEHFTPAKKMNGTTLANAIPAAFYRGGTSNALMIQKSNLPTDQSEWEPILAGALGSPDPYGRQLNGMGGGFSSLSKACIIAPSERSDADAEYTFVQMGIKTGKMDLSGTCGNMTSAVAPFAIDEDMVHPVSNEEDGEWKATVRVYNTNTKKIIHCTVAVDRATSRFKSAGDYAIDGVPGTGSRIILHFLRPGGSKTGKTLPTGHATEEMDLTKLSSSSHLKTRKIQVTLSDVANPAVIIDGLSVGARVGITSDELDADRQTLELLEQLRKEGARLMGMDPEVESVPKLVMVFSPAADADGVNLVARVLSMRQAHRAIPLTIALNLGVACQIPRTLPHSMLKGSISGGRVVIGHPSGKIEVGASMCNGDVEAAVLHRTARLLMRGEVYWR